MTCKFFEEAVEVDVQRRIVTLPKICCWYMTDFAPRRITASGAGSASRVLAPSDSLRVLVHYFKKDDKEKIVKLLLDAVPIVVKFRR